MTLQFQFFAAQLHLSCVYEMHDKVCLAIYSQITSHLTIVKEVVCLLVLTAVSPRPLAPRGILLRPVRTCGRASRLWVDRCPPPSWTWPAPPSGPCCASACSASGWAAGWPPEPGACARIAPCRRTRARATATPPWFTTACISST